MIYALTPPLTPGLSASLPVFPGPEGREGVPAVDGLMTVYR